MAGGGGPPRYRGGGVDAAIDIEGDVDAQAALCVLRHRVDEVVDGARFFGRDDVVVAALVHGLPQTGWTVAAVEGVAEHSGDGWSAVAGAVNQHLGGDRGLSAIGRAHGDLEAAFDAVYAGGLVLQGDPRSVLGRRGGEGRHEAELVDHAAGGGPEGGDAA